jgi:predicted pyridoxine 5'-phosphate oxidase superfamily flavin-nucleotide-binding protein
MAHRLTSETIDDEATLRALLGEPLPIVCAKVSDRINRLTREFVARAPRALLEGTAVEGKIPRLGILVDVLEAFTHCSKALLRSDLWNPVRFIDRAELPTNGQIHKELANGDFDAEAYDEARAARYARREGFY